MIGLYKLLPPSTAAPGIVVLQQFPDEPAESLAGLIAYSETASELERLLNWDLDVRSQRPTFVLGLVAEPDTSVGPLAAHPHVVAPFVPARTIRNRAISIDVLNEVRHRSVEGWLYDCLRAKHEGVVDRSSQCIRALIAHGVRGGTVARAARSIGVSVDTVERRVKPLGVSAGQVVRAARVAAFDKQVALGTDSKAAERACGWTTSEARHRVVGRATRAGLVVRLFGGGGSGKLDIVPLGDTTYSGITFEPLFQGGSDADPNRASANPHAHCRNRPAGPERLFVTRCRAVYRVPEYTVLEDHRRHLLLQPR